MVRHTLPHSEYGIVEHLDNVLTNLRYLALVPGTRRAKDPPPFLVSPRASLGDGRLGIAGKHLQYKLAGDLTPDALRRAASHMTHGLGEIELIPRPDLGNRGLILVLVEDRHYIGRCLLAFVPRPEVERALAAVPRPED